MSKLYRRVLPAALSLATLGQASVSLSRTPDSKAGSTTQVEDADALIGRGITLRRNGEDAEALLLFQQAEELEPDSTRVLVHLAATYQALGEWEAADRYLTRALSNPADPYIERHQSTLAAARHTIDGHIGSLQLTGGPRGTQVSLNGRLIGTLPIDQAVRIKAGVYTMEARLAGHYPVTRSVSLAGGVMVRESIELSPLAPRAAVFRPRAEAAAEPASTQWLTWTFAGLAVGAGVATGAAWATRERHAEIWNDAAQCLRPGQTRQQVCGEERSDGENAETWMWIGASATGAFAAAAVVNYWLNRPASDQAASESGAALNCGVGLAQLQCAGRF